jgi:uncharacterized membrane protein
MNIQFLIWCLASLLSLTMVLLIVKHLYNIKKLKRRMQDVLDSKDQKKAEDLIRELIQEL